MAISKVVFKTSPQDTGTVWIDATSATAAASDIISPKTAMLANGVVTTGTGSGGLVYETGTYTPASDVTSAVTISFQNAHTDPPFFFAITYTDSTTITTERTAVGNLYFNSAQVFGSQYTYGSSTSNIYGYQYQHYSSNTAPTSGNPTTASGAITTAYTDSTSSAATNSQYWATNTTLKAYSGGRAFKSGKTYKWIAVWTPSS